MQISKINVLGYQVYRNKINDIDITENKQVINTLNAYSYVVAKGDSEFRNALNASEILVADGFPVVLAAKLLRKVKINKIAGEDIFYRMLHIAQQKKLKIFFLGASEKTLKLIDAKMKEQYPEISMDYFSPPFVPVFSEQDSEHMCNAVNSFQPDVLFVGMTAPKQEKWVYHHKDKLDAKVICSIGAVFDFYAGTVKRPSPIWIKLKLEWFIRLVKEPKRLWKRYLVYSPIFFTDLFKAVLRN